MREKITTLKVPTFPSWICFVCKVRCVSENNFGNGLMSFVVTSLDHASEEIRYWHAKSKNFKND